MKSKNVLFKLTTLSLPLIFFTMLVSIEIVSSFAQGKVNSTSTIIETLKSSESKIFEFLKIIKGKSNNTFPKLYQARETYIVTLLIHRLENEFPGVCILKNEIDRMNFLSAPSKSLMSPQQFNDFVERSCNLRLYFVAEKNVFLFVKAAQDETGNLSYFGKNIAFQTTKSDELIDEFVTSSDLLAKDFSRSK